MLLEASGAQGGLRAHSQAETLFSAIIAKTSLQNLDDLDNSYMYQEPSTV